MMKEPWRTYYYRYRKTAIYSNLLLMVESLIDLSLPTLLAFVVNQGIKMNNMTKVLYFGAMMIVLSLIGAIFAIGRNIKATELSYGIEADLSQDFYLKVLKLRQSDLDKFTLDSLVTRGSNDIIQIRIFLQSFMRIFLKAPIYAVGAILISSWLYPPMVIVFLLLIIPLAILMYFNLKLGIKLYYNLQFELEKLIHKVHSLLSGIKEATIFNRFDYEEEQFERLNQDYNSSFIKTKSQLAVFLPLLNFSLYSAMLVFLLASSYWIRNSSFEIGNVIAIIAYFQQFLMAILVAMRVIDRAVKAKAAKQRLDQIFVLEAEKFGGEPIASIEKIEFKQVSFDYGGDNVLEDISFSIKRSQKLAILGTMGSGKSTLVKLLCKEYSAKSGELLYNQQNIENLSIADLRSKIAVVRQNDFLFSASIEDNLRLAAADLRFDEIEEACQIAQADSFINKLADKYQSLIGRDAIKLSGGQRQRLIIARALLKKPQFLILDDSTRNLDVLTEQRFWQALQKQRADLTTLIITQKIVTAKQADKILLMDKGRIVARGSHQELLRNSELYRQIYATQRGESDE